MPWSHGAKSRTNRLIDYMDRTSLDLALVSSRRHVYYFTGFESAKLLLPTYLLAFRNEEPILVTGRTERELAERTFGGEGEYYTNYDVKKRIVAHQDFVSRIVAKTIGSRARRVRKVGVEGWDAPQIITSMMAEKFPRSSVHDISTRIMEFRRTKDPDEVEKIRESCRLADFAYSVAKPLCTPGTREVEVYAAVHSALQNKVGTFQYFAGDFVSGERTANGGGPPTSKVLRRGETFYLDFWVVKDGYWSDTSRTFVVGGSASAKQARMMQAVKKALSAGEAKLRPGVRSSDVFAGVMNAFRSEGYGDFFNQHAGHCIGLEGQEPPFFIPGDKERLKEGMVCAIEPGLFGQGIEGMQLEDNYVVRKDGPERLTSFPRELA